jgi:hypothetical protein
MNMSVRATSAISVYPNSFDYLDDAEARGIYWTFAP